MAKDIYAFLMFDGKAEEAMNFYVSLFAKSRVENLSRYSSGPAQGKVMSALFMLSGRRLMCNDSSVKHDFSFTPATSLFVTCDSEAEIDRVFAALAEGGKELMPLGSYGFSRKFGWVNDRYGVSWQLNLPNE